MAEERLARLAREAAKRLEKSIVDIDSAIQGLEASLSREDACKLAERVSTLVKAYRPLEEGSLQPSAAYQALEPVYRVFDRVCRGGLVEDRYLVIALAVLGLLEAGKVSRAASLASILAHITS